MTFKAKLRKIGNSTGVLIPKQIITDYKLGDEIVLEVITGNKTDNKTEDEVITKPFKFNISCP